MKSDAAPRLSIVIATLGRCARLQRCIASIRETVHVPHETVVVSFDTGDGSREWLDGQPDLRAIHETQREGCTRAYNKGFQAARGEYVMWLNDDARLLPGAVDAALELIGRPSLSQVGMVAFYHDFAAERNRLDSVEHWGRTFSIYNVRGTPYANFGLLRRSLLAQLGFLDERYYFCGWDPDLSLKVQREAGLLVVGCRGALVEHEELHDERKLADLAVAARDNEKLFEKWRLPPAGGYPDPRPAYARLVRELALS